MIYLSFPKKGLKVSGDMKSLRIGKRCTVTLKGTVKGFSEREDSRSIDLAPDAVAIRNHTETFEDEHGDEPL